MDNTVVNFLNTDFKMVFAVITDITEVLREIITSQYKPGIVSEKERSLDCHQIHLDGEPWSQFYDGCSKKFDSCTRLIGSYILV